MTTQVDIAALSKAMIDAMVKNFTTEELKALADFYGSPVGKSAMQKFGAYMADIMPVVQAENDESRRKDGALIRESFAAESIAPLRSQDGTRCPQRVGNGDGPPSGRWSAARGAPAPASSSEKPIHLDQRNYSQPTWRPLFCSSSQVISATFRNIATL